MAENVTKVALENIHRNIEEPKKPSGWDKVKEYIVYTKGLTLSIAYSSIWKKIDKRFQDRKPFINLSDHGPIITINADKNTECAERFVKILQEKYDLEDIVNVGLVGDEVRYKQAIEAMMFIRLVRIFPEYCRQKAEKDFEEFITSEKSKKFFEELFSISGTIKSTDTQIDELIRRILDE